jgi:hypothetical protein
MTGERGLADGAHGRVNLREPCETTEAREILLVRMCAPEEIRTPNLLIRSQMLYPLSYGRVAKAR